MKKTLLTTLIALFAAAPLFGQDLIVKRDNEKIEARMVAVTESAVIYRLFSDTVSDDDPVYEIDKAQVRMIMWENGDHDDFGETKKAPLPRVIRPVFDYSSLSGELSIQKNRFYSIGGTPLTRRQVIEYMESYASYPDVLKHIKDGYRMKRAAIVLGSVGGFFIFIGTAIMSSDPNAEQSSWDVPMVMGLVIGGTGLGLGLGSVYKQNKAMQLYNENYADYSSAPVREVRLSLAPTRGGMGLQMTF